jgi:hypothetical protein
VHRSPLCGALGSAVDLNYHGGRFYVWEMESISESSQQQRRKPVTHGLEDQKRVSGGAWCSVCCLELELFYGVRAGWSRERCSRTGPVCVSLLRRRCGGS